MAKEKIGFVQAHRFRQDKKDDDGVCEYDDGTVQEHKELFPDQNPKARIEFAKPHRFARRAVSRGNCDYCGESHDEHKKHFPEFNPEGDRGLEIDANDPGAFRDAFAKPEPPRG